MNDNLNYLATLITRKKSTQVGFPVLDSLHEEVITFINKYLAENKVKDPEYFKGLEERNHHI